MNQHPGTLGRKLGMTQYFDENNVLRRVTVIEAAAFVVGKRTVELDGYSALIVGLDERKEKHTNKPLAGFFKKANVAPKRHLKEFRLPADVVAKHEVGSKIELDKVFEVGQIIDVCAKTRGRGFSGVVRRHNFKGQISTHGTHEYRRHGGSIGTNMTPGRTLKGVKMPGQHGNKQCSVLNLKVARILPDQDLLLVQGAVPGARNGLVTVRGAVKKMGGLPKAK
jgi:large subunit ribosomal protein L3